MDTLHLEHLINILPTQLVLIGLTVLAATVKNIEGPDIFHACLCCIKGECMSRSFHGTINSCGNYKSGEEVLGRFLVLQPLTEKSFLVTHSSWILVSSKLPLLIFILFILSGAPSLLSRGRK